MSGRQWCWGRTTDGVDSSWRRVRQRVGKRETLTAPVPLFPSFLLSDSGCIPSDLLSPYCPTPVLSMDGLVRKDLQDFVVRANDVIFMKLIRRESDVEDHESESFHPDFTHQIFGETENIFGYKDLKILMYYASSSLKRFVSVSFAEKIPAAVSKGVEADDVMAMIREHIPGPLTSNLDQFTSKLAEESDFRPVGDKINQFNTTKCNESRVS